MKLIFTASSLFLFFSFHTVAQNPLLKQWDYSYGGNNDDFLHKIIPTPDGGFLAAGNSYSNAMYEKSENNWDPSITPTLDCWLIKCDASGVKEWDRTLGGSSDDFIYSVILTSDSGYLVLAGTTSPASGNISQDPIGTFDVWLVKLNSAGQIDWEHRYGGSAENGPGDAIQLSDGGYFIGGFTDSPASGDVSEDGYGNFDYWVLRIDGAGNKIWDKRYGGDVQETISNVIQTDDGGFLLAGNSYSGISGTKTVDNYQEGESDIWFVKIDSGGNYEWDKVIGSLDNEYGSSIIKTHDHHYVIGESTYADAGGDKSEDSHGISDYWMIRTDTLLNIIWDHSVGGDDNEDNFGNIFETAQGNYILAGTSYSDINDYKSEENNGPENTWVLLFDTAGNKIWDKTIHTGYTHTEQGLGIQLKDGCYLFANDGEGFVEQEKTDISYGLDYWCIKFCDTTLIQPPTTFPAFAASDTDICEKFCINFFDSSTNSPTAWQWFLPGGDPDFSITQNPGPICYDFPGIYDVTLVTTSDNGDDTLTLPNFITVYQTPANPSITLNGNILSSSAAFAYQWQYNAVDILGATNQTYDVTQSGFYTIIISDVHGCISSSSMNVLLAGISEQSNNESFLIYPNPSDGIFNLTVNLNSFQFISITILNSLGQEIYCANDSPSTSFKNQIDLSSQPAGIYVVQLKLNDEIFSKKILIIR